MKTRQDNRPTYDKVYLIGVCVICRGNIYSNERHKVFMYGQFENTYTCEDCNNSLNKIFQITK